MNFLDGLSSALTAGTQGAAGYLEGQDKGRLEAQARARQIALDLLAQRKQNEDETQGIAQRANLASEALLRNAQVLALGQPKPADYETHVDSTGKVWRVDKTAGTSQPVMASGGGNGLRPFTGSLLDGTFKPILGIDNTHQLDLGVKPTAPLPGSPEWRENEKFKAKLVADNRPDTFSPLVTTVNGKQVVQPFNTRRGVAGAPIADAKASTANQGTGSAPMASKEGQFGEMLKKAPDLFKAAEALDVGIGQSTARDIAEKGIGIGGYRIPGTQGIGAAMLNRHPSYAVYQAALAPFVLANAHALSGARINMEQAHMIKQSIERQPGDFSNPNVLKQRDKNIIDQMNSIAGSLPREAVVRQEEQMEPDVLASLVARGYKKIGGSTTAGGRGGGSSDVRVLPSGKKLNVKTGEIVP